MSEREKAAKEAEADKQEPSKRSLRSYGKIFLMAGIVLLQAAGAYAIVHTYYPQIVEMVSSPEPKGGVYYTFKNIVVNPANTNGKRYLLLSMTVELADVKALKLLKERLAKVKDRTNVIISKHTIKELSTIYGREVLKRELAGMINSSLNKKAVRNLFFTEYVLQ